MNSLISSALALALAFPTVAAAQNRNAAASSNHHPSAKTYKFAKGERFDRSRAQNYRRIDYRSNKRLSAPPRGYTWVRAGDDALLVRLSNNVVTRVVSNIY